MLSDKLHLLGEKIEEIDEMNPIDFLSRSLEDFNKHYEQEKKNELTSLSQYSKQISEIFSSFEKDISPESLCCELYTLLFNYVRKTVIISYAEDLSIEPYLYKKQMDFLFKGKS